MVDLLPAYVNGTLDPEERAIVNAHLAACLDCRTSLSAWSAIAQATRRASERTEKAVAAQAVVPFKRDPNLNVPASYATAHTTNEEQNMHTVSSAIQRPMLTPRAHARPKVAWRGAVRPLSQIAAVIAIAATLISGINLFLQGSPSGTGGAGGNASMPGLVPANQASTECSAQAPSADRIASVLDINAVLTGNATDFEQWVVPSVTIDKPSTLPAGESVAASTHEELAALWSQFVACAQHNDASEYGLVSDDGLRRAFFQTMYFVTSAAIADTTDYSKVLAEREGTEPVATPEAKPTAPSGNEPLIVTAKTDDVSNLVLGDAVTLPDGRIVAALNDPTVTNPVEFAGIVVFKADGNGWLIDDFYAFHG